MREQDPKERAKNFDEVNLGYTKEEAIEEATRCLQCKQPTCIDGCPVSIDIPGFIKCIKEDNKKQAMETIKKTNNLPGVCGRVCPQEKQCEAKCVLQKAKKAIKIGYLERYASEHDEEEIPKIKKLNKKIAIIGSGPAGLTCAADLASLGYKVTIFEALHKAGGVLQYGIPEFRLPKKIVDKEIDFIEKLGVEIKLDYVIGKIFSMDELLDKFDAVFISVGAGLPYFLGIDGENLEGVYSANEFLTRVNLMKAYEFPSYDTPIKKALKTVVIGGGNVAMDAARCAKRLGSDVSIIYRRSIDEMPARIEEVNHAKEEEINFLLLTCPSKILGENKIEGIECIQMKLGQEDESGRRKPIPIEDSEFEVECDQLIIAIGQGPNPLLIKTLDIQKTPKCRIIVDDKCRTSMKGVFAGGDIASDEATVIRAMGMGKTAAKGIDEYLKTDSE